MVWLTRISLTCMMMMAFGATAMADESWYQTDQLMPSGPRVQITLGADVMPKEGTQPTMMGGASLAYGSGMFSVEAGIRALKIQDLIGSADNSTGTDQKIPLSYIGVPVFAKFNYIDHPMDTFSIKAGVMPAFLAGSGAVWGTAKDGTEVTFGKSVTYAVVGFTGTTDISDHKTAAFVLDGEFVRGLGAMDSIGTKFSGFVLSVGVLFSL